MLPPLTGYPILDRLDQPKIEISPVPATAMLAPTQASGDGGRRLTIQSIGRIKSGVVEDRVETIPTSPTAKAAINNDIPSTIPNRADQATWRKSRGPGKADARPKGNAIRARKNTKPKPDRIAIAVKGSTPSAMAGRAKRLPTACPSAVTTPKAIPCHKGRAST